MGQGWGAPMMQGPQFAQPVPGPPIMMAAPPVVAPVIVPEMRKFHADPVKLDDPDAPGPFARLPGVPPPYVVFPGSVTSR